MASTIPTRPLQSAARHLASRWRAAALAIVNALGKPFPPGAAGEAAERDQYILERIDPIVRYLIRSLESPDPVWRELYLGFLLHEIEAAQTGSPADRPAAAISRVREQLHAVVAAAGDSEAATAFDRHLQALHAPLAERAPAEARVLFVGDCILFHILGFLTVPLLAAGIRVRPDFCNHPAPARLKEHLARLAGNRYDLVCYSPYSNMFNPRVLETQFRHNPLQSPKRLLALARDAHRITQANLRTLIEQFDCPISVQNTINLRLHAEINLAAILKSLATRWQRRLVAREVNRLLDTAIAEINADRTRPLILIDEAKLCAERSEIVLGQTYAKEHNNTVLAQTLATRYAPLIASCALLSTRKVVALDLDDTLWTGTVGEGAVEHRLDRQRILKDLRSQGILLAIVSKNEPGLALDWSGAALSADDFVALQINWDPKPVSLRRIAAELNLALKDFVFIDDRPDQRQLVTASIPEITPLDASADFTWEMLRAWSASLPRTPGQDRTRQYHERRQRESFLHEAVEAFDQAALYGALELKAEIGPAARKDLPRVVELINRTNQFNTNATRTTPQEAAAWIDSPAHTILIAHARDKFGDMGIVSVMVIEFSPHAATILAWVLSCRVFGYGIETALLNHLRRLTRQNGIASIQARIVETPHNQPCRNVYAENGFQLGSGIWNAETKVVLPDPEWLAVTAR